MTAPRYFVVEDFADLERSSKSVSLADTSKEQDNCGMDQKCICHKNLMKPELPPVKEEPYLPKEDSMEALNVRLTAARHSEMSIFSRRMSNPLPIKLWKNKVDRAWHKRYNWTLPDDQQFDLQPYDEINSRDEDIAVEYFYGPVPPIWLTDGSKEAIENRQRILERYNKDMRKAEEAQAAFEASQKVTHTRVESIISVNRTKAAETSIFGPSLVERSKIVPVIIFMEKLVRLKNREKEQLLRKLPPRSKWRFLRHPYQLDNILRMVEAERKIRAAQKFRRTIKVVRAVVRFIRVISIMSRDARHVLTEIKYFQEMQKQQTQKKIVGKSGPAGVSSRNLFEPNKYHFSSRFKISPEIRMILTKPWNLRTDEEVTKVVDRLQDLRCFVEYPVSFQRKLARLAWLIEVAADLAIIREGHIAADFYFMLAGKAKIINLCGSPCIKEKSKFHTLRILHNGDAFGDESMSHPDSERTYSVITLEHSALLSLSSVDYVTMLLKTQDDEQAPEHIIFLSTLSFLADFPKQKLIEEGDEYIKHYYLRAGSLISGNLRDSEYIYVVKMGSCRVLVEMPPPEDAFRKSRGQSTIDAGEKRPKLDEDEENFDQALERVNRVSSVMEFLINRREEIESHPSTLAALMNMRKQRKDKEYMRVKEESENYRKKSIRLFRSLRQETIKELGMGVAGETPTSISKDPPEKPKSLQTSGLPSITSIQSAKVKKSSSVLDRDLHRSDSSSSSLKRNSRTNVEKPISFVVGNKTSAASTAVSVTPASTQNSRTVVGTNMRMSFSFDKSGPHAHGSPTHSPAGGSERQSKSSHASSKGSQTFEKTPKLPHINPHKHSISKSGSSMQVKHSHWKLVRTLVKGDYIGQEWVDLNRGPYCPPDEEMALVSDGCEVIMMHREFLIKYLRKEL